MNSDGVLDKLREIYADERFHRKVRGAAERLLKQISK